MVPSKRTGITTGYGARHGKNATEDHGHGSGHGHGPVYAVKCVSYEAAEVERAVDRLLQMAGGLENMVPSGSSVFLKINLLSGRHPDQAVTTHPEVIAAVGRRLVEHGCHVVVGDSPGVPHTERTLKNIYRVSGVLGLPERTGVELNYDLSYTKVVNATGKSMKEFVILTPVVNADVVITLPKMKTHMLTGITGAVKLNLGFIPGMRKAAQHVKYPSSAAFSQMLIDLAGAVPVTFSIMDAVTAMEGDGPSGGTPRNVGLLMASSDIFSLDYCAAVIMNFDPRRIHTIRLAGEQQLGPLSTDEFEFHNPNNLRTLIIHNFQHPTTSTLKHNIKNFSTTLK